MQTIESVRKTVEHSDTALAPCPIRRNAIDVGRKKRRREMKNRLGVVLSLIPLTTAPVQAENYEFNYRIVGRTVK